MISFANQALKEYNSEHSGFQGGFDGRPFWNVHSSQFIYNPRLSFPIIPGAKKYIYTATDEDGKNYSFESTKSISFLTEIWKDLPTGLEQYEWYVPVDSSISAIAEAFMEVYTLTGDKLWYEKACALFDKITRMQNEETGLIPTQWITEDPKHKIWNFWTNCHLACARILYNIANKFEHWWVCWQCKGKDIYDYWKILL